MKTVAGAKKIVRESRKLYERPLLTPIQAGGLQAVFKVLANDTRLRLLHALVRSEELCVTDLANSIGMKPQAISNQLQRLSDLGILASRRDGIDDRLAGCVDHLDRAVAVACVNLIANDLDPIRTGHGVTGELPDKTANLSGQGVCLGVNDVDALVGPVCEIKSLRRCVHCAKVKIKAGLRADVRHFNDGF